MFWLELGVYDWMEWLKGEELIGRDDDAMMRPAMSDLSKTERKVN